MWYMILLVFCLIIVGIIVKIFDIRKIVDDYNFTNEYYKKFNNLFSEVFKNKSYKIEEFNWLMANSDKMQYILGDIGIISYTEYNMYYKNIPILLNTMNKIFDYVNDSYISQNEFKMVSWCQNIFMRKIGILNEYIENTPKKLLNPFFDLSIGIKYILSIPINILYSIGIISYSGKNKIEQNILFKITSGIISLLTILSTIMAIVVGWEDFIGIVQNILSKI